MSTIPMKRVDEATGLAKEIYESIMKTYGTDEPHGIYQLMGHTPEFLAASWPRSRFLFGIDTCFSIRDKHVMTMAISATNNCEYCVRIHTERLFQLGLSREQVVELLMVVDVMNGYDKFAEGIRLGDSPSIPGVKPDSSDPEVAHTLGEIATDSATPDTDHIYDVMATDPTYMRTSWERAKLCFVEEGKLGIRLKHLIALCIAATNSNDYFVQSHTRRLKALGLKDNELVEALLIVDLSCGYNRYVQGMQVELERTPFGEGAEANKARSVAR
jgi:AhpD family alkylhydroperoxidase